MVHPNIVVGPEIERIIDSSLGELMLMLLKTHGENILQIDATTNEELSAFLILSRAIRLAKWFKSKGIGVGDSVSIMSENRLEFCLVPIAAFFVGATFAPLNPDYTPGELKHVLSLSKPKVIFTSHKTLQKLVDILPSHPYVKQLVFIGDEKITHNIFKLNDIIQGATANNFDEQFEATEYDPAETVATILCSSGTTGLPKGVMCSHDSMTAFIDIARATFTSMIESDDSDAMMGLVPFFHSFGFMTMFLNLLRGKTMIVLSKFKPKVFLDAIVNFKIARLIVPPPILLFLVKHPLAKEYDLSCLKEVRAGAAPMGRETELKLRDKFKFGHVSQGYGMTETTLSVMLNPHHKAKVGSVGQVVAGMMAKVIDEDGNLLGPYQEGELCLKGPLVMKGYVGDDVATRNTIDGDNWLHTGDVAYYDDEKYFFIVDRLKELIKYKAFQVAPAELESLLVTHPAIEDAAVIGLPDEDAGELPLAYVVKRAGKNVTGQEVEKFVADNVSPQKQLRGGVIFVDSIPRNPTGKILRRVLREEAKKFKSKL